MEIDMTADIEMLKLKHIELDHKIKEGYTHFLNDSDLTKMKKQKLILKEHIEKLTKEQQQ